MFEYMKKKKIYFVCIFFGINLVYKWNYINIKLLWLFSNFIRNLRLENRMFVIMILLIIIGNVLNFSVLLIFYKFRILG